MRYRYEWENLWERYERTYPAIDEPEAKLRKWLSGPESRWAPTVELSKEEATALVGWVDAARRMLQSQHEAGLDCGDRISRLERSNGALMVENGRLSALAYPIESEDAA